jgi:phosphatidylglycerophosphatase A
MRFISKLIATGAGLGYIPMAPGTMGTLGGCLIALMIKQYSLHADVWLIFLILIFTILGIWSAESLEKEWGKDPPRVVIDEVVGIWIALVMLPHGWIPFIAAFIIFRFLDIYKPLFIAKAEQIKGGWGIMADDAIAGFCTNLFIQMVYIFIK